MMSDDGCVAGCCPYDVVHPVVFMSTCSPRLPTPTVVLLTDGPALAAGLVTVQVGLPPCQHFTRLKLLVLVAHGERLIWHGLTVKTLHRNLKPLCRVWCLIGRQLILLFRTWAAMLIPVLNLKMVIILIITCFVTIVDKPIEHVR